MQILALGAVAAVAQAGIIGHSGYGSSSQHNVVHHDTYSHSAPLLHTAAISHAAPIAYAQAAPVSYASAGHYGGYSSGHDEGHDYYVRPLKYLNNLN